MRGGGLRFILSLRFLIVTLSLSGVLFTIVNGYYSTYQLQKNLLIDVSLESNRVYAEKLAHMTESFLELLDPQELTSLFYHTQYLVKPVSILVTYWGLSIFTKTGFWIVYSHSMAIWMVLMSMLYHRKKTSFTIR